MKAAFCRLLEGVLRVCWKGAGITGRVAFAVAVVEFWAFLSDTCCCASSCVVLLFHLFFYRAFHSPFPMLLHSVVLYPFKPFCCLIFPTALPSVTLFSFSRTSACHWQLHWHWWLGLSALCQYSHTAAFPEALGWFGKCQKKTHFYNCSNSWNYRGQAVSCNALVLPGPVGAATVSELLIWMVVSLK